MSDQKHQLRIGVESDDLREWGVGVGAVFCELCGETFVADVKKGTDGSQFFFIDTSVLAETCLRSPYNRELVSLKKVASDGDLLALLVACKIGIVYNRDGIDPTISNFLEYMFTSAGVRVPDSVTWETMHFAASFTFGTEDEARLFATDVLRHCGRVSRLRRVVLADVSSVTAMNDWRKTKRGGMGDPKIRDFRWP